MPIYIKQTNAVAPNYIKVKGKVYKKTNNTLNTFGTYITGSIEEFKTLDEADYKSVRGQDTLLKLRPIYAAITTETFTPAVINLNTNTFNVTVITKQTNHPLHGQGSTFCLSISSAHAVPINLIRGKKYTLKQYNNSNTGHKLRLTTDSRGLTPIINMPDNSYTGTAGTNGELTFILPLTSRDNLFLSSEGGEYMGIQVNVDKFVES